MCAPFAQTALLRVLRSAHQYDAHILRRFGSCVCMYLKCVLCSLYVAILMLFAKLEKGGTTGTTGGGLVV